ncbi:ESX secretion-associated protein EspG [Nocardia sp. NBC_00508]|uniref:ESX secretion-associated protein EspG n=1 Tax=Nocardia sp. NBC_00508 TaxID=2975992 RepID=UPI002E818D70|nr:ESX secretion-associated protein EspG [Nocardia sp. NBC_00508]WUD68644.1 ESX secretion-associated protein EspG [Nocardia sp. NBC_00508]
MPTMTNDGLLAASGLVGVQTLPLVLGVGPRQDSAEAWQEAQRQALTGLRASGLVDGYDELDSELAAALHALAQPDRELVARIYTETGPVRVCLARRGSAHAVAVRTGDAFDVRTAWADDDGAALARPVLAALGSCPPAEITSFSALSEELRDRLDGATSSSDFTQAVYALGVVDQRDAIEFGLAMSSCQAHAEIVAYAHEDGATLRSSGAVAVYDTTRGRIAASPGAAADRRVWSTFTPGSDHRIAQAISALVESLPGGRWMP